MLMKRHNKKTLHNIEKLKRKRQKQINHFAIAETKTYAHSKTNTKLKTQSINLQ